MRKWMLLLLLVGCAGADELATGDDTSAPDAATTDAATTDVAPAATERTIPLCEGSPPESPELCQSLRYGSHGHCNFWIDCNTIH